MATAGPTQETAPTRKFVIRSLLPPDFVPPPDTSAKFDGSIILDLPTDLRLYLYRTILVTAPVWRRGVGAGGRHGAKCRWARLDSETPEAPPMLTCVRPSGYYSKYGSADADDGGGCRCARREGLGLLATCHAVYLEAAPVFWGQNRFVFLNSAQFVDCAIDRMRPQARQMLRHVVIWYDDRWSRPSHLFHALFLCKGLRTIEIEWDYLHRYSYVVPMLRDQLPGLERLHVVCIRGWTYRRRYGFRSKRRQLHTPWRRYRHPGFCPWLVTKVGKDLPLDTIPEGPSTVATRNKIFRWHRDCKAFATKVEACIASNIIDETLNDGSEENLWLWKCSPDENTTTLEIWPNGDGDGDGENDDDNTSRNTIVDIIGVERPSCRGPTVVDVLGFTRNSAETTARRLQEVEKYERLEAEFERKLSPPIHPRVWVLDEKEKKRRLKMAAEEARRSRNRIREKENKVRNREAKAEEMRRQQEEKDALEKTRREERRRITRKA